MLSDELTWVDVSSLSDDHKATLLSLSQEDSQELLDALVLAEAFGEEWWQKYLKQKFPNQ